MVIRKCRVVDATQLVEIFKVVTIVTLKMTLKMMSRIKLTAEELMRPVLYFELKLNPNLLNFNYYISNSSILFHFIKVVVYILFIIIR